MLLVFSLYLPFWATLHPILNHTLSICFSCALITRISLFPCIIKHRKSHIIAPVATIIGICPRKPGWSTKLDRSGDSDDLKVQVCTKHNACCLYSRRKRPGFLTHSIFCSQLVFEFQSASELEQRRLPDAKNDIGMNGRNTSVSLYIKIKEIFAEEQCCQEETSSNRAVPWRESKTRSMLLKWMTCG